MRTSWFRIFVFLAAALFCGSSAYSQALSLGQPNGDYEPLHAWYDVSQSLEIWEGRTDQYDDEYLVDVRDTETGSGDFRGGSYGTNVETWAQFDDKGGDFWPTRVGGLTGMQNGLATWEVRNAAGWDDRDGWSDEDGVGTEGIGIEGGYSIIMAMNIYETTSYNGTWDVEPFGPNDDAPILNGSTSIFNEGPTDVPQEGKALLWLDTERDGEAGPVWVMDAGIELVAGPVTLDQWQVHSFIYNGEDSEHYIDGQLVAAGDAGDLEMSNLQLWSSDGGWHRAGNLDFAEGLFYDEVLSAEDRAGIESYLSNKWGFSSFDPSDFDADGQLGLGDMNLLLEEVNRGTNDATYDINKDGTVDANDITMFASSPDKLNTFIGDANLDGEFNSSDLVAGLAAGQYEDAIEDNSRWESGDWNGDLEFTSGDLVAGLADGGYEAGPRAAAMAIPEPSTVALLLLGSLTLLRAGRRRNP